MLHRSVQNVWTSARKNIDSATVLSNPVQFLAVFEYQPLFVFVPEAIDKFLLDALTGTFSLLTHSSFTSLQGELIGRQRRAKTLSSLPRCNLNRWPSWKPNGSLLKWGAWVGRRDRESLSWVGRKLCGKLRWWRQKNADAFIIGRLTANTRQQYPKVGGPSQL